MTNTVINTATNTAIEKFMADSRLYFALTEKYSIVLDDIDKRIDSKSPDLVLVNIAERNLREAYQLS